MQELGNPGKERNAKNIFNNIHLLSHAINTNFSYPYVLVLADNLIGFDVCESTRQQNKGYGYEQTH